MCHGIQGHQWMRPGLLPLIIRTNHRFIANREVGRLDERLAQILIAVLRVARSFAFAVVHVLAADAATVGDEARNRREPSDVTSFQENGAGRDRPDAGDRLQQRIAELGPPRLPDLALDRVDFLLQTLQHHRGTRDRLHVCGKRDESPDALRTKQSRGQTLYCASTGESACMEDI